MFACTLENGMCQALPDTCKTPTPAGTVPVPYPNIGQFANAQSSTCSGVVKINGMKAFNLKTKCPMSQGDEAGSAGGVVSGKAMGEIIFTKGCSIVFIEGPPAVNNSSQTAHNGAPPNASGGMVTMPSQNKVQVK
jgi:hypothetical protein